MILYETAYYNGKLWCAYDLKDSRGNYKEDYRLAMRLESQSNRFTCPDCGEPLILCAGPVMEPYFKHHENSRCIVQSADGRKKNLTARRILYHIARESFPDALIEFNKKFYGTDGTELCTKADILITVSESLRFSFDYLSCEIMLNDWLKKHRFYKNNKIKNFWFLNQNRYHIDRLTTFEYLIHKNTNLLSYINCDLGSITMKQIFTLCDGSSCDTVQTYDSSGLTVQTDGTWNCGFEAYALQQAAEADKKAQERLDLQKMRYETDTSIHIVPSREQMDSEQDAALLRKKMFDEMDRRALEARQRRLAMQTESEQAPARSPAVNAAENATINAAAIASLNSPNSPVEHLSNMVVRRPLGGVLTALSMKMIELGEVWDLPALTGSDRLVRLASQTRFTYLKKLGRELGRMEDRQKMEERICEAIRLLNRRTEAYQWR